MWKDIDGFEDRYEISHDGEVRNKNTKKLLTSTSDKDGYQQIGIRKLGDRRKVWFFAYID
jgi:NUMOD4 motif